MLKSISIEQNKRQISILTINVHQFPWPIPPPERYVRADKLAQKIIAINADVVVIQELWSSLTRRHFYRKISPTYPHQYADTTCGKFGLGLNSGLMIISRYPILDHIQHRYTIYRGLEDLAGKGTIGIKIAVDGAPVYIFTTHLQAGAGCVFFRWVDRNKPATTTITWMQLEEAKKMMDKFIGDTPSPVIFMAGDLNADANSTDNPEYQNCMKALGDNARDTYQVNGKYTSTTWGGESRIDFIITMLPGIGGYSEIIGDIDETITDHRAVYGKFDLPALPA